jgi:putative tRNA adenosine deaminase-associated protein
VTYFAAALARRGSSWTGAELDLAEVEDLDGVVETLRTATGDDSEVALLMLEENDEWFGIVRVDEDGDPRVFVSDGRVVETSELGGILGEAATVQEEPADDADEDADEDADDDEDDEEEAVHAAGDPVGDADLLSDLGVPARRLLALSAEEGQLPADILTALSEAVGCLDPLEALRET